MKEQKQFIGADYYKVKHLLKNQGIQSKKILFHKNIKVGYDTNNEAPVRLVCTIEKIDLSTTAIFNGKHEILYIGQEKETVEHKKITSYNTLSICAESRDFAGQTLDIIKELFGSNPRIKKILKIWDEWHLNDMQPNCIHQKALNCNNGDFTKQAAVETKKCPLGYDYGSKWLVKELPDKVKDDIIKLFLNFKENKDDK